ncbi:MULTISPECIES: hypothetical protein [unclassified Dietzia]|uniref:hypothetical protein n=1 Tax=unclassified Dietzia TaxID=2617939 RepID=UPI0015F95A88|nr:MULTISPECIES: hypothetical protein [unclassified Dietzia]MBB1024917.1 hypothetical protein [Dietzia sp. DQ12-76]MBB1029041.1 hypothetical protein [Dietzia sp. DQ11-38-2]
MTGLTVTFSGPDGQTVAAVDGVVVVDLRDPGVEDGMARAAASPWPVTATGPWWLGGGGSTDPSSVFWAARTALPREQWTHTGDTPPVPRIPAPEPGVVF